jgi:hypothetical protein
MQLLRLLLTIKPIPNNFFTGNYAFILSVYVVFFSVVNDPHGTIAVVFHDSTYITYCNAYENTIYVPCGKSPFSNFTLTTFFE